MPRLISTWAELKECTSETHILKINVSSGCGWIEPKFPKDGDYVRDHHYLSTHTFYGHNYEYSTKLLQKCGFDVELANWDKPKEKVDTNPNDVIKICNADCNEILKTPFGKICKKKSAKLSGLWGKPCNKE